jgi:heme-degrading monooxygenase HmoA
VIAVIFEVTPVAEHKQTYLGIAADLRPMLNEIEGFISIERFASLSDPTKILSLSFWRDEEAVQQWRNTSEHRDAQNAEELECLPTIGCVSLTWFVTMG